MTENSPLFKKSRAILYKIDNFLCAFGGILYSFFGKLRMFIFQVERNGNNLWQKIISQRFFHDL